MRHYNSNLALSRGLLGLRVLLHLLNDDLSQNIHTTQQSKDTASPRVS